MMPAIFNIFYKNCHFTNLYCLFPSTLDIQEFYEATLMDGSKSVTQKTMETLEVASKWEQQTYATPMRPDNSPVCTVCYGAGNTQRL